MIFKEIPVTLNLGDLGEEEGSVLVSIEHREVTIIKLWILNAAYDYVAPRLETKIRKQIDAFLYDQAAIEDELLKYHKEEGA